MKTPQIMSLIRQTAGNFARKTLLFSTVLLLLFGVVYYFYRTYTISEGSRSGVLFKISKRGLIFKTFEGQLHLGGSVMMTKESIFDFSVSDAKVYSELQNFEGKNVKLYYHELIDAFIWQGETDYIVYRVEPIQ